MKDNFRKDILITIIGQVIVLLVTFGVNKIVSNHLGPTGYTEFSIAKRSANVISYIMLMGLGIAIPRFLPLAKARGDLESEKKYILLSSFILLITSFLTIILGVAYKSFLSEIIFGDKGYEYVVISMLIFAFSTAVSTLGISFYRALDQFYMYSIAQIILQLLMLCCTFVFNKHFSVLLLSWAIATGIYGLILCYKTMKREKCFSLENFNNLKKHAQRLLIYCIPRIPGEFVLFAYTAVPIILINHKVGIERATPFATGITINTMVTPLFSFVGVVLLPLVSKSIVDGTFESNQKKIKILGIIYSVLSFCAIIIVELFPEFLVSIAFSNEFLDNIYVVKIMILSVFPNAIYLLLRNPIDAISEKAYNTINLVISFIILIIVIIFSNSIFMYAFSFFIAYSVLGILSITTWKFCCKKHSIKNTLG